MTAPAAPTSPAQGRGDRLAVLALAAAIAALAPFLALCAYAHPTNDDFAMAIYAMERGVLGAVSFWLQTWSGRYFASFLAAASPLTARSLPGWRWMTLADLLVLPAGAWLLVSAVAPPATSRIRRAGLALGFTALHFGGMPDPARGLYWLNGAVCYVVGEGLALGAVACWLRAERAPGGRRQAWTLASALLILLAAGTNELIALLLVGCFAVLLASAAVRRRPWARTALMLAIALAGTAATLLVPGTVERLRASTPPGGRHLLPAVAPALVAAARLALRWLASPLAPAGWLVLDAAAQARREDPRWSLPHPGLAGPALAAAYLAAVFLPYYGGGALEPHTLNLVHALFVGGVLFLCACAGAWRGRRRPVAGTAPLRAAAWALLAALALLPPTALRVACGDLLSGRAARYDQALLERYLLLERCWYTCDVPPLADPPRSLFWFENAVDEAADSPSVAGYKDGSFGVFFEKARIRLAAPAPGTRR